MQTALMCDVLVSIFLVGVTTILVDTAILYTGFGTSDLIMFFGLKAI